MITREDVIAFCKLTPKEIAVIAEYSHAPFLPTVAHAMHLLAHQRGVAQIHTCLKAQIHQAFLHGDQKQARVLRLMYKRFKRTYPLRPPT